MSQSNGHCPNPTGNPDIAQQRFAAVESQRKVRAILRQALDLKDLAYETALDARERFASEEEATRAKARAVFVTSLAKAFSEMVMVVRITLGKPGPGNYRPPPKPTKAPKRAAPLVQLADPSEYGKGPDCGVKPQPVVSQPRTSTTPDSPADPQEIK